jgi:hypothetical protein
MCQGDSINSKLNDAIKLKQPLFTTEDGVDIFEDDIFWNVGTTYNLNDYQITNNKYELVFLKDGSKQFSTKEKAEKYILMNKPCLSLQDLLDSNWSQGKGSLLFESFIKTAKQKLNK